MTLDLDLGKLVSLFCGKKEDHTPQSFQRNIEMAKMILESNIMPGIRENDFQTLVDMIKKNIYRQGGDVECVLEFESLFSLFLQNKEIEKHWNIIYFFYKLSEQKKFQHRSYSMGSVVDSQDTNRETKEYETEEDICKEVFYVLQGTSTRFIKLDCAHDSVKIDLVSSNAGIEELFQKIAKCGLMVGQLSDYVEKKSSIYHNGPVQQGVCVVVGEYLRQFCNIVSEMQMTLQRPTVLSIWLQLYQKRREIEEIHRLLFSNSLLSGGALLGILFEETMHGDQRISFLFKGFFEKTVKAFLHILWEWITTGRLFDYFGEFFIKKKTETLCWTESFYVNEEDVPSFIPSSLIEKILISGITAGFSRHASGDTNEQRQPFPDWLQELELGFLSLQIEKVVSKAYSDASESLRKTLFIDNNLVKHLQAIQKYILLLSGDFAHSLIEQLGHSLSRSNSVFFKNDLVNLLETAIQSSCKEKEVTNRLDVRLLSEGRCGWDSMCLQYQVSFPLNVIITPQAMERYQKIFLFLWKIKKAGVELLEIRRKLKKEGLRKDLLFVFAVSRVVFSIEEYSFSIIKEESLLFEEHLKSIDCTLGGLVDGHKSYLKNIETKILFGGELGKHMTEILDTPRKIREGIKDVQRFTNTVYLFLCLAELEKKPCFKKLCLLIDFNDHYGKEGSL